MFSKKVRSSLVAGAVCLGFCSLHAADFVTGQAADFVFGQPDFTTNTASTTATGLSNPQGIAFAPSGKVFITRDDIVLRYSSIAALTSGSGYEASFGVSDFNFTRSSMSQPYCVIVDGNDRMWVADSGHQRILRYENASTKTSGDLPDGVLGEPDYTTSSYRHPITASNVFDPHQLSIDPEGNLWVADTGNTRVLRYNAADLTTDGAAASVVLGQANFTSAVIPTTPTASNFLEVIGVLATGDGNVYVSDDTGHRVLRYANASTLPDGTTAFAATAVIGQPDFTTTTANLPAAGIVGPESMAMDGSGTLFVVDTTDGALATPSHHRLVTFKDASSILHDGTMDVVLGQANFTATTLANPPTASSLNNPVSLTFDADGHLWLVDNGDNRALRFTASNPTSPVPPTDTAPPTLGLKITSYKTKAANFTLKGTAGDIGTGVARVLYKFGKGKYLPAKGTTSWTIKLKGLKSGKNRVLIEVVDGNGNTSTPKAVTVTKG